jgi:hypothetical protein
MNGVLGLWVLGDSQFDRGFIQYGSFHSCKCMDHCDTTLQCSKAPTPQDPLRNLKAIKSPDTPLACMGP